MSCVYEGAAAIARTAGESRYFTQVLRSNEAAAMIRACSCPMQELTRARGVRRRAHESKEAAVIGAASWGKRRLRLGARHHVLIDRDQESAERQGHAQSVDRRPDQEGPRQGKRSRRHHGPHLPTADYNC